jgi:Cytidylyltransferase-like
MLDYKTPAMPEGVDLHAQLDLTRGAQTAEVDTAWQELNPLRKGRMAHFAWKLLRDTHYAQLFGETGSVQAVYDAGFFVDRLDGSQVDLLVPNRHELTTPYHKLTRGAETADGDGPPVVLVTTGGFSPVHYGHLSMMETAKSALERTGRVVAGGYISPSHDHYVNEKYDGEAKLGTEHRVHLARLATDESDWLMVDPWESAYLPTDINFTDVIRRLKTYLGQFAGFDEPPEVFYVAGADNAGFTDVLKFMDGGVCVSRGPQFNELPAVFQQPEVDGNPNLLFVPSEDPESEFSSSKVRSWKPQLMPADASKAYFGWRMNTMNEDGDVPQPRRHYIVRDDGEWSLQQYFPEGLDESAATGLAAFKTGVTAAIKKAFEEVELPDEAREVDVHYFSLDEQQQLVDALVASRPTLNIDACTNGGNAGINFSRLFEACDGQLRPYDLVSRPGFPGLEEQVAGIAPGDYLFLDDDIATGSTLNHLIALLPEEVRVNAIRTLFNESRRLHPEANTHEVRDMVDLKDFILGAYVSGLVVTAPDREDIARAPYMLPFVSGFSRANIPLSTAKSFSVACWGLNRDLFNSFDHEIVLADATPEFQTLMTQLGFDSSAKLADIAAYYEGLLSRT